MTKSLYKLTNDIVQYNLRAYSATSSTSKPEVYRVNADLGCIRRM